MAITPNPSSGTSPTHAAWPTPRAARPCWWAITDVAEIHLRPELFYGEAAADPVMVGAVVEPDVVTGLLEREVTD